MPFTFASWLVAHAHARLIAGGRDRGDVPGWVLVTLMTAGLVTALWVVAKDQLVTLLDTALTDVIK